MVVSSPSPHTLPACGNYTLPPIDGGDRLKPNVSSTGTDNDDLCAVLSSKKTCEEMYTVDCKEMKFRRSDKDQICPSYEMKTNMCLLFQGNLASCDPPLSAAAEKQEQCDVGKISSHIIDCACDGYKPVDKNAQLYMFLGIAAGVIVLIICTVLVAQNIGDTKKRRVPDHTVA